MTTTPEPPDTDATESTGPMVLLSQADIARRLGFATQTVRMYRSESTHGRYKDRPVPEPAFVIGEQTENQVPGWLPEQMQDWKDWSTRRPGRWDPAERAKAAEALLDAAVKAAARQQARVDKARKALADARKDMEGKQ